MKCQTCFSNIIHTTSGHNHICQAHSEPFYELSIHMQKPQNLFSLKGSGELNLLKGKIFTRVQNSVNLMSAATSGIFAIKIDGIGGNWSIEYQSTVVKNFGIGIAIFSNGKFFAKFKLVFNNGSIFFVKDEFHLNNRLSLIACIGLIDDSIEVRTCGKSKIFDSNSQYLKPMHSSAHSICVLQENPSMHCFNCSGNHTTKHCLWPFYNRNCRRCLVVSLNGFGHVPPCSDQNTTSLFQSNISVLPLHEIFKFRLERQNGELLIFNYENFEFEESFDLLFSQAVNGIFSFKSSDNFTLASFTSPMFSRFAFMIAVLHNNKWRLRYRVVTTNKHGLLVFPLHSTMLNNGNNRFSIPSIDRKNNVAIFGIKPHCSDTETEIEFKAFTVPSHQFFTLKFMGEIVPDIPEECNGTKERCFGIASRH